MAIVHPNESESNSIRQYIHEAEPKALRTKTLTQAVLARSAGVFHWTPENRKLFDFTSGVLVANLGHNPVGWLKRFRDYMGWPSEPRPQVDFSEVPSGYYPAVTMTAYNAITPVEALATERLLALLQRTPKGRRLQQVMWAASGSEAVQKALWASMSRDRSRPFILASRHGFHGKKGLAGAVTGSERDHERDWRVKFFSFPMHECIDVTCRDHQFDPANYRRELDQLWHQFGPQIGTLITEPYLGGGGSYHPPLPYLKMVQDFCREHDIVFILDEVQSNFGRTASLFAFEAYGLEPDLVVLGKGLGNGVPVAAAVGRADIFRSLDYGEGSDTWSANPLCCAAVCATIDEFIACEGTIKDRHAVSQLIERRLIEFKAFPFIAHVRGEKNGMVWGLETRDYDGRPATEWAHQIVLNCYLGNGPVGIHLLGPLASKVIRISPPITITPDEASEAFDIFKQSLERMLHARHLVDLAHSFSV